MLLREAAAHQLKRDLFVLKRLALALGAPCLGLLLGGLELLAGGDALAAGGLLGAAFTIALFLLLDGDLGYLLGVYVIASGIPTILYLRVILRILVIQIQQYNLLQPLLALTLVLLAFTPLFLTRVVVDQLMALQVLATFILATASSFGTSTY